MILHYNRYLSLLECNGQKPSKFDNVLENEQQPDIQKSSTSSSDCKTNGKCNVGPRSNKIKMNDTDSNKKMPSLDVLMDNLPKKGQKLVNFIKQHKSTIDWNKKNYELIIHSNPIVQSNIIHLLTDALTNNKKTKNPPLGLEVFYKALSEINTPLPFINNRQRRAKLLFYKTHDKKKIKEKKSRKKIDFSKWITYPVIN